jgi:hypothetical protein
MKNNIILTSLFLAAIGCGSQELSPEPAAIKSADQKFFPAPLPAPPPSPAEKPASRWEYESTNDPISGAVSIAVLSSVTELSFDFPYQGIQNAYLNFVNRGGAFTMFLGIEKGQFICFMGCEVVVKAGDEKPFKWSATSPQSGSTTLIFLDNPEKLFNKIKSAKNVYFQVTFFQVGNETIHFDMTGADWTKIGK